MNELQLERAVAERAARVAGDVLRRHRAGSLAVGSKARGEIVTSADIEADAAIRAELQATFPADVLYTEESPDPPARHTSRRVWIVDPIDATSDYARGGDEHVVSIGLAIDHVAVLGVVYNPTRRDLWSGVVGAGVTHNGAAARTASAASIADARVTASRKEWDRGLSRVDQTLTITTMASLAHKLARVASGLDDGVISEKVRREWGTCAGVALVAAAGGIATDLDGVRLRFNRAAGTDPRGLVAAGAGLHPGLLLATRAALGCRSNGNPQSLRFLNGPHS